MICHVIVDLDSVVILLEVFILWIESHLVVRFVKFIFSRDLLLSGLILLVLDVLIGIML